MSKPTNKPSWQDAPKEAMWLSQDGDDGTWWWWEVQPFYAPTWEQWGQNENGGKYWYAGYYDDPSPANPAATLEARP